jgi:hypothetical protein
LKKVSRQSNGLKHDNPDTERGIILDTLPHPAAPSVFLLGFGLLGLKLLGWGRKRFMG